MFSCLTPLSAFSKGTNANTSFQPIDYSAKLGPGHPQLDTAWCWAYTAADALSYALGLAPSQQISAADLAIQTLTASTPGLINNIQSFYSSPLSQADFAAINGILEDNQANLNPLYQSLSYDPNIALYIYSKQAGYCTVNKIPDPGPSLKSVSDYLEQEFNYQYSDVIKNFIIRASTTAGCIGQGSLSSSLSLDQVECLTSTCHYNILGGQFEQLQNDRSEANADIRKKTDTLCGSRVPFFGKIKNLTFVSTVDNVLSALQSAPVMAFVDDHIFMNQPLNKPDHWVLVIGARSAPSGSGQYELKVRNSWDCANIQNPNFKECKGTDSWIDAQSFLKAVGITDILVPQNE